VRHRVADQVVDGKPQPARPTPDRAEIVGGVDLDLDAARAAHVLPRDPVEHVGDVDELAIFHLRQLTGCELPERGDDRLHAALRP
jgi:hypothetical protein